MPPPRLPYVTEFELKRSSSAMEGVMETWEGLAKRDVALKLSPRDELDTSFSQLSPA